MLKVIEMPDAASVLDKGSVRLVDVMPRLSESGTADYAVVQAARVSYGLGVKTPKEDRDLIRYLFRHRHCYDAETEVLTATGWKKWPDVTNDDVLGIFDSARNTLCYERPEYLTKDRYVGEMYRVNHGGVDLLVTPEHTMYVKKKRWCSTKWNMVWEDGYSLVPAKDLGHSSMVRYIKTAPYNHEARINFRGCGFSAAVSDTDAMLKLMGFFIGDGSVGHTSANQISFHLKKHRKKKYLRDLASRLGWTISEGNSLSVNCIGISAYFRENFYDADGRKRVPPFLMMLNARDAASLLDGLRNSDGSQKRSTWEYSTSVAEVAEAVQLVALHAGIAAHRGVKCTGMWTVSMLSRGDRPVVNQGRVNTSWEQYDGYVYCAKTRTGVLVVRRNGKIVLSGNSTPVEMVETKWHVKCPLYVARQWVRTRTASMNEVSGRYTEFKDEFQSITPDEVRAQSMTNKQGSFGVCGEDIGTWFSAVTSATASEEFGKYTKAVDSGVAKEQARINLPLTLFTEFYWKINLHNLLHFLALRCDSHAQLEIRVYADAMREMMKAVAPVCMEAWEDYHPMRSGMLLSRAEVKALGTLLAQSGDMGLLDSDNARERSEWAAKLARICGDESVGKAGVAS